MPASIERRLRAYGEVLDDAAIVHGGESTREPVVAPSPRSPRGLRLGIALASAAALIVVAVVVVRHGAESNTSNSSSTADSTPTTDSLDGSSTITSTITGTITATVTTVAPRTGAGPSATTDATLPNSFGTWTTIAPSPLSAREDSAAVWTGSEYLVWGGRDGNFFVGDGAAYNPATDSWRPIATNQVSFPGTASAWTGAALVVLMKNGGSMYDLATDAWSDVPSVTGGADGQGDGQSFESAFWNGTEIIGVGGRFDASGSVVVAAAAWAPGTDTWRLLPPSPMYMARPAGEQLQYVQTATGLVAWATGATGEGWSYDSASQTWTELAPLIISSPRRLTSSRLVWSGSNIVALVSMTTDDGDRLSMLSTLEGEAWLRSNFDNPPLFTNRAVVVGDSVMSFGATSVDTSDDTPDNMSVRSLLRLSDGELLGVWTDPGAATTGVAIASNGSELFAWGGRVPSHDDETTASPPSTIVNHATGSGDVWRPPMAAFPADRVDVGCVDTPGATTLTAQEWYDPAATGLVLRTGNVVSQTPAAVALGELVAQQLPGYSVASTTDWSEDHDTCAILRVADLVSPDGARVTVTIWQLVAPGALWVPHVEPFGFREPDLFVSESDTSGDRTVVKVLPDGTTIKILALGPNAIDVSGGPTTIAPPSSTNAQQSPQPTPQPAPQPAPQSAATLADLADVVAEQIVAGR